MAPKQQRKSASSKGVAVTVRRAKEDDAARIAELCGQLGYPASTREIRERLRRLHPWSRHAVLVAVSCQRNVIGWLHVSLTPLLEVKLRAEVNGLVVDEHARSCGAGARLLQAAEDWARQRNCRGMSVRSNVIRDRAHSFYLRNGYEYYKTQKAFRKIL